MGSYENAFRRNNKRNRGKEIMEKGKCKFCGKKLPDPSNIRCMDCDNTWNEGRKHGRLEIKSKLREIFQHLNNLVDLEK